jgi:hypothetical protein
MAAFAWKQMKPDERWVYEEEARNRKRNMCQKMPRKELASAETGQ